MNDVAITNGFQMVLSEALSRALERQFSLEGKAYLENRLPPDLHAEAARALVSLDDTDLNSPADPTEIRGWLELIGTSVRNTPEDTLLDVRANAIFLACDDLPGWLFNSETQRRAMASFDFFPAASEVRKLLEEFHKPFARRVRGLRMLVKRGPEQIEQEPSERTRPCLAYVREAVRELQDGVAARESAERTQVRKFSLERANAMVTDAGLLAALEEQAKKGQLTAAAQTRLESLRAKRVG